MLKKLEEAMSNNPSTANMRVVSLSSSNMQLNANNNNTNGIHQRLQQQQKQTKTGASSQQSQPSPIMGPAPGLPSLDQLSSTQGLGGMLGDTLMTTSEESEREMLEEFQAPDLDGLGPHIEQL